MMARRRRARVLVRRRQLAQLLQRDVHGVEERGRTARRRFHESRLPARGLSLVNACAVLTRAVEIDDRRHVVPPIVRAKPMAASWAVAIACSMLALVSRSSANASGTRVFAKNVSVLRYAVLEDHEIVTIRDRRRTAAPDC